MTVYITFYNEETLLYTKLSMLLLPVLLQQIAYDFCDLFVIQSRVTGGVTSIARGVKNGGSRQEEDITSDISSDLWNNPAGEYA